MKMKRFLLISTILLSSCSVKKEPVAASPVPAVPDVKDVIDDTAEKDTYSIWQDPCVKCDWYFCEDLSEVWRKQICVNKCEEPNTIVFQGECEQQLECNPTQYLIEKDAPCLNEEGEPGIQDKVCVKGLIQYTECIVNCTEEVCNGIDDDCDGEIDEGQLNNCGLCGPVPAEVCDNIDNDCDGLTDEDLVQACSTACEDDLEYCIQGQWLCTAKQPFDEICDGLDNDCDGLIDEDIECFCTEKDVGILAPCTETPLVCGEGYKTCECEDQTCTSFKMSDCLASCHWFPELVSENQKCDPYLGAVAPEDCNNHDDNCNQLVDEDLFSICYSGPPETLGVGICKPGNFYCNQGVWGSDFQNGTFVAELCMDEIIPMDEDICNGEDTNCDGVTEKELEPTDILLIVDMSGSMLNDINAVLSALSQFAVHYSDSEIIKWGLVLIAVDGYDAGLTKNVEKLKIEINLTDFESFMTSFSNIDTTQMDGADEQSLDAIYLSLQSLIGPGTFDINSAAWFDGWGGVNVSDPEKENWDIEWRQNTKRVIILFTDEEPQSYLVPKITQSDVIDSMNAAPGFSFYVFSAGFGNVYWDNIVDALPKAKKFDLVPTAVQMYSNLLDILDETACDEN